MVSDVLGKGNTKDFYIDSARRTIYCRSLVTGDIVACVIVVVVALCLYFNLATAVLW